MSRKVKFKHPVSNEVQEGEVVREQNIDDGPVSHDITIVNTQDDIVSVPNSLLIKQE